MPIIDSAFKPAWWLRGAHAQTLWPALFRRRPKLALERQRLELPDGDFLDLFWSGPTDGQTILVFHGLQGSIESHYAKGIMKALNEQGLRTCLMHFRGCGGTPNRLPIGYHSGKTDDPQKLLDYVIASSGQSPFGAIGVSLGGNVLLKWLGEQGDRSPLQRAMAISVPFRLEDAAHRLERGLSRLYQKHLITSLQQAYRDKFGRIESPLKIDVDHLLTFRDFDHEVTAALHGFDGVDDYYARCSSRQFIPEIRVSTLILHASDDPFMYSTTRPNADELPSQVTLEASEKGGHVGFVSGHFPGLARYYIEQRAVEWMTASQTPTNNVPRANQANMVSPGQDRATDHPFVRPVR